MCSSELHHQLDADQLLSEFSDNCNLYTNAGRMAAALNFQQWMTGKYLKTVFSDPDHTTVCQITDKSKYLIVTIITCFQRLKCRRGWTVYWVKQSKAKQSRYTPRRRLRGEEYSSYSFLTSALDGGEWSVSCPGRALPRGKDPQYPLYGRLGGPEPVWTKRLEEKSFAPARDRTPITRSSSL
jgi:hypothetical protein